ncbi:Fe-S cluster assembly protein SufD [Clostridium sp. DJ247]|uniref:Fe-S cluster assembly protein SufD n=1 Tax=Clostridium sp. DJ247 TaxID=2726188 RepID=UPI0016265108|nr:Fe-S cluster assembly protein SufD [Clostridium sp. DJ247]MBC2581643.1 Fe-S cluster assembly protein SufD [Clostridium sp. DJ247]
MNTNIKENVKSRPTDIIEIINNKEEHKLNQTVVPTWRHLKVNSFLLKDYKLPSLEPYKKKYISFEENTLNGVEVLDTKSWVKKGKDLCGYLNTNDSFGVSKELTFLGEKGFNSGVFIRTSENADIKSPIKLNFVMNDKNPVVIDHNIVIAEKGSKVTLVIDYSTDNIDKALHNGVTKVFAMDNSNVTVVKIQRMNDKSQHFDSNVAFVERGAKVNWITIEFGSETNITNYISNLNEDNSSSELYSAYFVDGSRKQDIYYTANHFGRRTESIMDVKGVLKDKAKKVFRGNIDFKKGSTKSKGAQTEDVLLLDAAVKSDSIPMLLCEEDDVEGAHAASVGQMDEDKLFYLMSRGFNEKEAKKLVVEAKFTPIFDRIPVKELRELLIDELNRRLVDEQD